MHPQQSPPYSGLSRIAHLAILAFLCMALRSDAALPAFTRVSSRMLTLPKRTLWAWERPEDLRAIDPVTTAIAVLDQTILVADQIHTLPRRQPILYPASARTISVVRIEVARGTPLDPANAQSFEETVGSVVSQLLLSANRPGIAALQVDFDATRSQRAFYKSVLRDLRAKMPADLPLSITALASWCSYDDWISSLPVDEAVPMFFRMEPDRRRAPANLDTFRLREPLCQGSIGLSTRERWPDSIAGRRIYIFPDHGWRTDLSLLADRTIP